MDNTGFSRTIYTWYLLNAMAGAYVLGAFLPQPQHGGLNNFVSVVVVAIVIVWFDAALVLDARRRLQSKRTSNDKRVSMYHGGFTSRTLKPGESFIDEVTVTQFYDLSQPGEYTISLARPFPPRQNLGEGRVKSNTITLTVLP
jgi:hypothetical protein